MGGEWPVETIEELLRSGALLGHQDGNHGSQYPRVDEFGTVGVPFLTAKLIDGGRIDISSAPRLAEERANDLRIGFAMPGDVVLSHNATIGRVAILPEYQGRILLGTSLTYFRVNPTRLSARYLAAFFAGRDFQNQLRAVMSHTTRNQVPITAQRKLKIVLPPLADQRAIASILGALDDKIELNRKTNATLEAMARALFKSWFVDFDPVRAKAERRVPSDMDTETVKLLSSEFVDSALGPIPRGWSVVSLQDMSSYLSRGIGPAYLDSGGVRVLNQKCIRDHRVDLRNARRHDDSKKSIEGRLVQDLDILVNSTGVGTLGRVAQIWSLTEKTIVDSHVTIVRAVSNVDPWFLGVGLIERETEIEALGEGSTGQTELSRSRLGSLLCLRPPEDLQRRFGAAVSVQFRRVAANEREAQILARVRDELLPRLLSGELSVDYKELLRATL